MKSITVLAIFLVFCVASLECCQITMKLRSKTKNKFRIQVVVPALNQESERILFTKPQEKKITIKGENCGKLHWVVRTWKLDREGNWVNAKEVKAKLDGRGWLRVNVGDDLNPFFMDRSGVMCSEGFCG